MKKQNIKNPHTFKSNKKCSECGVVSDKVNNSTTFNRNLCIDCLRDLIINSDLS